MIKQALGDHDVLTRETAIKALVRIDSDGARAVLRTHRQAETDASLNKRIESALNASN